MAEIWKQIPGHEGYEASSYGRIRSIPRRLSDGRFWSGRVMRQRECRGGYLHVALPVGGGKYRNSGAHRLVAEAFLGARPSKNHQVAHSDGNPKNNRVGNLRWATAKENATDRDLHGRTAKLKGSLHGQSKLTERSVVEMRKMKAGGASVDAIANLFGVSRWTAFDALSGRTWGHV